MITSPAPAAIYNNRIEELNTFLKTLKKKKDRIAWSRFFILLAAIASFFYLRNYELLAAVGLSVTLMIIFFRLVAFSTKNNQAITNTEQLLLVNKLELQILSANFRDLPDGTAFLPACHEYAHDLDIFGRASLFQYINRTTSEQGNRLLADWLLAPTTPGEILQRQEAAKELSTDYSWRQQLQAFGSLNRVTDKTEQKMDNWLKEPGSFRQSYWKWLRYLFPAIICSALILNILDLLPSYIFYFLLFVFFSISGLISRKATLVYFHLDKIVKEITSLSSSIEWIENRTFHAPLLHQYKKRLLHNQSKASVAVTKLKEILDRLDYRLNPLVFIPLNTFFFWDLQQVMFLEKWKDQHEGNVKGWFQALAKLEAISSVANIAFNHPSWCYPTVADNHGTFISTGIGHPLIAADKRVNSSFSTSAVGHIALITGSNMAGKSTFLRSVGVNMVLAMMGAPVCAEKLFLSPMKVVSSMRVTDNLDESTSTFYAELKKLKQIIEAVNSGEKVFLLLDEILRGTNSLDRHTGSKALLKQLLQHGAVGMLATHDLELAKLSDIFPDQIHNYHFDVQVAGEELYFDYKLKEGVCESLNASILMKKIGIEL